MKKIGFNMDAPRSRDNSIRREGYAHNTVISGNRGGQLGAILMGNALTAMGGGRG